MADDNTALGIINLTPLPLEAHRKAPAPPPRRPGQPMGSTFLPVPSRASLGAVLLKPFEQVDFPWGDEALICISLRALRQVRHNQFEAMEALSVFTQEIRKDPAISTLPIDATFVRNAPRQTISYENFKIRVRASQKWQNFVNVTNNSGQAAKVYLLEAAREYQLAELNNGQTWKTEVELGWTFQCRNQSDEMIGMTVVAAAGDPSFDNCTETLVLTETFLDEWRLYKARQAKPKVVVPVGPARLIGAKRQSTPPPTDPMFITASTVREDFVPEAFTDPANMVVRQSFNGLANRVVRDVEIAGPTLLWSAGNPALAPYHGRNASDIRTLTICADRMEVDTELLFPRTNVIIHARELVFNQGGSINTTPLPHAATHARSPYLTVDLDDRTNHGIPTDENGEPTYRAADGADGEPGGDITLCVRRITLPDDRFGKPDMKTPRFICRGGKGQAAEPGRLRKYEALGGAAKVYGKTSPILAEQLKQKLKQVSLIGPYEPEYRWPGEVAKPEDIPIDQFWIEDFQGHRSKLAASARNPLRSDTPPDQQTVVRATIRTFDMTTSGTRNWDEHLYFLPGTTAVEPWWSRWVADGRGAYPGGWPGEGGKGGTVTSVLASAAVEAGICDMRAGEHGDPTPPVAAMAPPGPNPAYDMLIEITRKLHPSDPPLSKRPSVTLRDISGRKGLNAPGCKYQSEGKPGDQFFENATGQRADNNTGTGFAVKVRPYKNGGRNNDQMPNNLGKSNDLSWLHPAALTATVGYARMAYRNGHREQAATAIEPYYRLILDERKVASPVDPDVRLARTAVLSMQNSLEQNLDYYGNPPGWVPRLDALTNLKLLENTREAAYETFYFADKMLSDYEAFENTNALSKRMSDALTKDINEARGVLGEAYRKMPEVLRQLDETQQDFSPIETAIVELRNKAIAANKDKVMVQRFVSAALTLVGGVAKGLPIGQPFLGAAGGALGSIGEFDWNAAKPLDSARSAFASLGGKITTFVQNKQTEVEEAVTRDLVAAVAGKESKLTLLTRAVEDEEAAREELTKAAETAAQQFMNDERENLASLIAETETAIAAAKNRPKTEAPTGDGQTGASAPTDTPSMTPADSFLEALKKQRTLVSSSANKMRGRLQRQLVLYQRQQAELEEQRRIVLRQGDDEIKRVAKKLQFSKVRELKATRDVEDTTAKVEARKQAAGALMTNLGGLGEGLTEVGGAVVSMLTPVSDEDPDVVRLAEQMMNTDPEMRAAGKRLTDSLKAVTQRKKAKVSELIYWQRRANTSLAAITGGLATQAALSRQRQSLAGVLNPSVKEYLRQTRERAKDALAESIYWFVKSHQYENLRDVDDTFYNFDSWTELLQNQELAKLKGLAKVRSPAITEAEAQAEAQAARPRYLLSAEDFKKVGNDVFKAEVQHIGQAMLGERQKHGVPMTGKYMGCVWERTPRPNTDEKKYANLMLDNLEQGQVVFNFVRDFNKGSLDWDDARVVSVKLKELALQTAEDNLSLTVLIEQLGDMTIAQTAGGERTRFVFRIGRDDQPIGWRYNYNHNDRRNNSGLTGRTTEAKLDESIKALVNSQIEFREYHPALFSDYRIRFTDIYKGDGKTKKSFTINRLEMDVELSSKV
jgi:hypothetical protein